MEICNSINTIRKILVSPDLPDDVKIKRIEWSLPDDNQYKFISQKDNLLEYASDSKANSFKLLATFNGMINIYQWCDEEYNFIGLINFDQIDEPLKIKYTLDELPNAIDHAEKYLEQIKNDHHCSGSPYFISDLQIMEL